MWMIVFFVVVIVRVVWRWRLFMSRVVGPKENREAKVDGIDQRSFHRRDLLDGDRGSAIHNSLLLGNVLGSSLHAEQLRMDISTMSRFSG